MDDEFGADDDLLQAMAAADPTPAPPRPVQQPKPQRLDKAPPTSNASDKRVVQPTPQAIPKKTSGSTILVSPRQRGNPVLTSLRTVPWEFSDTPADYVLGLTTCALFLSLKYHRLHPVYIYKRIENLQGKYNLRILLTLVDIDNHEDPLRELSKTSMVNNVTIVLCWSAAEAARYLELYKSCENANFTAIRGQQSSNYADRLVDFVTVPRSLNKTDAVALVANFGSLRNAINADPEQLGMLSGWGGVKVKRWAAAVEEPFRAKKAAKRGPQTSAPAARRDAVVVDGGGRSLRLDQTKPPSQVPSREMPSHSLSLHDSSGDRSPSRGQFQFLGDVDDEDDEDAMLAAAIEESKKTSQPVDVRKEELQTGVKDNELSGGVAAALAKLREND
ncbi:Mating-type switching protein swi10 [Cladobotryum mycophilum]|uniref:Mating-type switching protein swi10 n=1 Tax=Cladobotryum mycophilum TaxID=491253 RepID=A0ABR0S6K0_9HYPO